MIDQLISTFVDKFSTDISLVLLQILADESQGGMGYKIKIFDPVVDMDGWEIDHSRKIIKIDQKGLFSNYSPFDRANALKCAVETEFLKTRASLLEQYGGGTGKLVIGTIESIIGAIGIMVPEPGTTVGGCVVLSLGGNTIYDGMSQIMGYNQGKGINLLSTGFGYLGSEIAELSGGNPVKGRRIGELAFLVSSIAVGSFASMKIIRLPKKTLFTKGVGGQQGGFQIGRFDFWYKSLNTNDGLTIISMNNNANQSFLRFVTHNGRLVVNGRIVGFKRVLEHETSPKAILKGLLQLMAHGSKF